MGISLGHSMLAIYQRQLERCPEANVTYLLSPCHIVTLHSQHQQESKSSINAVLAMEVIIVS